MSNNMASYTWTYNVVQHMCVCRPFTPCTAVLFSLYGSLTGQQAGLFNQHWTFWGAVSATEWSDIIATRNDTGCCSSQVQIDFSIPLLFDTKPLPLVKSFISSYLSALCITSVYIVRALKLPILFIFFYFILISYFYPSSCSMSIGPVLEHRCCLWCINFCTGIHKVTSIYLSTIWTTLSWLLHIDLDLSHEIISVPPHIHACAWVMLENRFSTT